MCSKTLTGRTVVPSATTCPGRCTTTCRPDGGTAAAERTYRWRAPPEPNHSTQTRRNVQYDGTDVPGPKRSATYWWIHRSLVRMLLRDRCTDSWWTAKIEIGRAHV